MKSKTSRILLFLILFSFITSFIPPFTIPNVRAATNYYVSTTGDDGDPGTLAQPFRTIQQGLDTATVAGDTVYIRGGTYNEWGEFTADGTTGSPITLTNYNGEWVTIDGSGSGLPSGHGLISIGIHKHLVISNLILQDSPYRGIASEDYYGGTNPCNNITISNCTIQRIYNGRAVYFWQCRNGERQYYISDINVNNCTFYDIGDVTAGVSSFECLTFRCVKYTEFSYNTASGFLMQNAVEFHTSEHITIDHNIMDGTGMDSSCVLLYVSSGYADEAPVTGPTVGYLDYAVISNNTLTGACQTLIVGNENLAAGSWINHTTVENNVIAATSGFKPFQVWALNEYAHFYNVVIRHNTVYATGGSTAYFRYTTRLTNTYVHNHVIANNIFYTTASGGTYQMYADAFTQPDTDLLLINNDFCRAGGTANTYFNGATGYKGTGYITTDPLFETPGSDFRLQVTSPAIDAGSSTAGYTSSVDILGHTRPSSGLYDMGAYEYTGTTPTVTTSAATSVGAITAILHGNIVDNGSADILTYGFQYGITTGFGSTITGYGNILGAFLTTATGLTPGKRYYFRAFASNAYSTAYGSTLTFITQPYPPVSLTGTSTNATTIVLTWAKGTGANYTRIQRGTVGYPSGIGAGSNVYNGTSSLYANTGLTPGTLYYYSSWSMTLWGTTSLWNSTVNSSTYTLTRPEPPSNLIGNQCVNLTHTWVNWTNGTGKDYNVVVKKTGSVPSTPSDGTVIYNGTANHTLATITSGSNNFYRVWSLAKETTPSTSAWSATAPYATVSGILPGSIITINPGVYFSIGNTNYSVGSVMNFTQVILTASTIQFNDTNFTTTPVPSSTKVNITLNYLNEDTTATVPGLLLMNFSVNTPISTSPIAWMIQGMHPTMQYVVYHNGLNDSTITANAAGNITFTNTSGAWDGTTQYYEIYFMHGGAFGGLTIGVYNESNKAPLIFNCTIVNHTGSETIVYRNQTGPITISMTTLPKGEQVAVIIDARNHEMRIYYLDIITGVNYNLEAYLPYTVTPLLPSNLTYLYYFTVIDERGYTISSVRYHVYGLVNYTNYELVQDGYSDGNGKFDVWLLPGKLYKVNLSKIGYQNDTFDYITGTTDYSHIFKLLTATNEIPDIHYFYEQVHFSAYRNNVTSVLHVNYTDDLGFTTDCQVYVYEINESTGLRSLFFTYTSIADSDFTCNTPCNNSNSYEVVYKFNHTYFGYRTAYILITGYWHPSTTEEEFNALFVANFGYNPFGWSNVVTWFLMIGCFFSFNRRDSYMAMLLAGFLLLVINYYIGFFTLASITSGAVIPIIMILFGILMLIRDRYRFGVDL